MKRSVIIRTCVCAAALSTLALQGCGTPHSQQVRHEARDRFDRAGAQVVYDQARQAFNNGQFDEAMGHIDRAIARFPKDASYHLLRGRILTEMKRTDQARDAFAKAIEIDPKKPEPHYFLGIVYQRWRQLDDALKEYTKAGSLDPNTLHYLCAEVEVMTALGRYEQAEQRLMEVNTRFEFSPVIDRLRADVAKCKGDDAMCAAMLSRASIREESKSDSLEELAYARYSGRDWNGVLEALDNPAMKKTAARPDLVRLRARCLLMLGRAEEARDVLLPIRMQPDRDGKTLVLLGNAAWRAGDWDRVRECGLNLIRTNPTIADGYLYVGGADYAKGKIADSVTYFEQALSRDPERESTRRMLAETSAMMASTSTVVGPVKEPASAGAMRSATP